MRRALFLTFLLLATRYPLLADATSPVATILCYHEVDAAPTHTTIPRRDATAPEKSEERRYTATPQNFVAQLDYLQQNGYHVIPLGTLVDYLNGKVAQLPARAVVITVDDGWACAYSDILPALRERNMPWTLFVYPKIVGRGSHAVTWEQLTAMSKAPGVTIGSHSFTHPFLTMKNNKTVAAPEYQEFLRHELLDSKSRIQKAIGEPVRYLCYPFGDYDGVVADAATRYGYEAALTTERGPITRSTPVMALKRYLIHNDTTLEQFRRFLVP